MGFNRKLPPDDELIEIFKSGMTGPEIAAKYDTTRSAVTNAKRRLYEAGRIGADAPVRRYPQPNEHITVRESDLTVKSTRYVIKISLPRIPTIDGAFQGNQQ